VQGGLEDAGWHQARQRIKQNTVWAHLVCPHKFTFLGAMQYKCFKQRLYKQKLILEAIQSHGPCRDRTHRGTLLQAMQNCASSRGYACRSVLLEASVENCGRSLPEVEQGDCAGYGQAQVLAQVGVGVQTVT